MKFQENHNTVKISYSCMPNIKSKISTHNKKVLNKPVNQNAQKFNCINKNTCPLKGNCLLKNILYVAIIKSDKKNYQPKNYKAISENTFKKRCANYKRSFNISKYKNETIRRVLELESRKLQYKSNMGSEKPD